MVEDPKSESCSSLVRSWLSECVGSHGRCERVSGNVIPTRLIDVGTIDGLKRPHLHRTVSDDQKIPYMTLSHCWGPDDSKISRLTESNLEKMVDEIDESTLSKSFQDAITITRGLNIRYLWIDALCIIQDSAEDWAIESAKMAQYYRGGKVMISALASPSADNGILHPRTGDTNSVKISLNGTELSIRLALEDAWTVIEDENRDNSPVRQGISVQPLNHRAWTLQERLFAPRIIHYTAQQLIWQCKTCIASEDNQFELMSGGQVTTPLIDLVSLDTERSNLSRNPTRQPTIRTTGWYKLLRSYTSRQITYSSDLLPGISGLAREIQALTGARYLAGIWDGSPTIIIRSLLWRVADYSLLRGEKPATPACNGSPSWSWASVSAEIAQKDFPDAENCRIVQPDIDPSFFLRETQMATSNPFGQVSGGKIQFSGFVHSYTGPTTFAEFQTRKLVERLILGDMEEQKIWEEQVVIYDNSSNIDIDSHTDIKAISAVGEAQKQPEVVLDIPNEDYDFSTSDHDLLFMCRWDQELHPTDELSAEQQFLLLRRLNTKDDSKSAQGKGNWPVFERVGIVGVESPYLLDITASEGWKRRTGIIV